MLRPVPQAKEMQMPPCRSPNHPNPVVLTAALALALPSANADPGLWAFDQVPLQTLQQRHGTTLPPGWLDRLQAAALNLDGASAALVSARGLVLTNHHVAIDCIDKLSSSGQDLVAGGFVARRLEDEQRCPGAVVRTLLSTQDISAAVSAAAAAGRDDADRNARRKSELARQESTCGNSTGLRCEVVALYSGALHHLYRYREWDDVRLVFAPEAQAANFGGDADNFTYPRHALDVALLRVYDQGRPLVSAAHLRLATQPLAPGDVLFVAGHPGRTQRLLTVAQLQALRDVQLPLMLASAQSQVQLLQDYSKRSPEAARQALDRLLGTENWLKSMRGQADALGDPALLRSKTAEEAEFRAAYARRGLEGDPWRQIEAISQRGSARFAERWAIGYGYQTLLSMAGTLVELANERQLPEDRRLAAYRDAALPALERRLKAQVPFYKDLEVVRLAGHLHEATRLLGARHPFVLAALDGRSPEAAAEHWLRVSRLDDAALRETLLQGGLAAIAASNDPLLRLAERIAPLRREIARFEEEEVETPLQQAAEQLGQARFAVFGRGVPPDATGTLRLSFGSVGGYVSAGLTMPWKTTWGGWLARADSFDGQPPFDLPPKVAATRTAVAVQTPLNFVFSADIVGGNSGSPVVNRQGEWVGVIFDSNLEGLGNGFVYTDERARAVAVHAQAIVEALDKVYAAPALAQELRGGK
jgi:hypothetical protein